MRTTLNETTRIERTPALCLGLAATVLLSLAGVADTAQAKKKKDKDVEKIVFASDQTTGKGVNNPEGDYEIFVMNPDGKKREQLTRNAVDDFEPTLSHDGEKIAFTSQNVQPSNPEGDPEIYLMNTDGSDQQNLTNNVGAINDFNPDFSPDNQMIAFTSRGAQTSNPEGDFEVYLMNALDGSEQQNLTNTASNMSDFASDFSPDGQKIAYSSFGIQPSNPEGDDEIYKMNAVDGSEPQNLTNTADGVQDDFPDYAPDGKKIVYDSDGNQSSNPEGDDEIYKMNTNGSDKRNLTDTGGGINDSTPDFGKAKKG